MENKKLEQARKELNSILNNGVKVTIEKSGTQRKGLFGKHTPYKEKCVYELQQPILAALDLINYYVQDISLDESNISEAANPYPEIRLIALRHMDKIAHAVAVALLNRDAFVKTSSGYVVNGKRIEELTGELLHHLTPGKLFEISQAMAVMCNLSDFLNSIRLMQVAPDRIEPTKG